MKKSFKKRILALAAALVMTAAAVVPVAVAPVEVQAATTTYKTLAAGTWAAKSYNSGTYTYYKIKVEKAGMLTFSFKALKDTDYPSVYITTNKADVADRSVTNESHTYISYNSNLKSVAVEAGTYYLEVESGKAKYTYKAMPTQTNYSIYKATSLAASTKATAMFTPKRNYARWYKIKNPSLKKISIYSNTSSNASNIEVYNSKMQKLQMVESSSAIKYTTKTKQKAGTYYIRIKSQNRYYGDYDYAFGNVATVSWK